MNLGSLPSRHARYRPHHTAVVFGDTRLTYREFNRRINRLANALRSEGIGKGDKVATVLPNCLELLEVYWAAAKLGAVVVPLSPLLRGTGLATLLGDSDTVLVVTDTAFRQHMDPVRGQVPAIGDGRYFLTDGDEGGGYRSYRAITSAASDA